MGGVGDVSVQGECARRVCKGGELYMGMWGCCVAAALHKSKGEWWAVGRGWGCECAR